METVPNGTKIRGENRSKSFEVPFGTSCYSATISEMGVKVVRI